MNNKYLATTDLPFAILRAANVARLPLFRNRHGQPAHNAVDGSDWSLSQWVQAIAGELGEYANVRKKFDRADLNETEFAIEAAKELADVLTYVDLLAFRIGVDLGSIIDHNNFGSMQSAMFEHYGAQYKGEPNERDSLAQVLLVCVQSLADVSKVVREPWQSKTKIDISAQLYRFIEHLYFLCCALEIDIAGAIVNKFNEVSEKIKVDVYIVKGAIDDGASVKPQWMVSAIPF